MRNLTIAQRFLALTVFVSVAVVFVFLTGFLGGKAETASHEQAIAIANARNDEAYADMMHDGVRAVVLSALYDASQGKKEEASIKAELADFKNQFRDDLAKIENAKIPESVKESVRKVKPAVEQYLASAQETVNLAYSNPAKGRKGLPAFIEEFEALETGMSALNDDISKAVTAANTDSLAIQARTQAVQVFSVIIVLVAAAVILIGTGRKIRSNMVVLSGRLNRMADRCIKSLEETILAMKSGDLTKRIVADTLPIPNPPHDEIGDAVSTFNRMLASVQAAIGCLNETLDTWCVLVTEVRNSAAEVTTIGQTVGVQSNSSAKTATEMANEIEQVSMAGEQTAMTATTVATGSDKLAHSAYEATSALGKLQTAIESIKASSSKQTAANAKARQVVQAGSEAIVATIASMERIEAQVRASSDVVNELGAKQARIGTIVQTINGIADQTNLLALNAAIEAARAGEHGRGFAVVAEEVRKLAEQSSAATKEIENLIKEVRTGVEHAVDAMGSSANEVSQGTASSGAAKEALEDIMDSIDEVEAVAHESIEKVEEMSTNAETVSNVVQNVEDVTRDAAAAAEELSASSQQVSAAANNVSHAARGQVSEMQELDRLAGSLEESASRLMGQVGKFKCAVDENVVELKRVA